MNITIQQLQYIVAVDTHRHFKTAAEHCFVTQPTLSMMIQKLETALGAHIFDRSRQPVIPTELGEKIIRQARRVLHEMQVIPDLIEAEQNEISGELRLGIIPTAAPYILPLFVQHFTRRYPAARLKIMELTTAAAIKALEEQTLDAAILATPLGRENLQEEPLYYEQFAVFAATGEKLLDKKNIAIADLRTANVWLLEEGHCLRNQVLDLCRLKAGNSAAHIQYESGSIETLVKMVKKNGGITIVPGLAVNELGAAEKKCIRYFKPPAPVRQMSLVTYRHFMKKRLLDAFKNELLKAIPAGMKTAGTGYVNEAVMR